MVITLIPRVIQIFIYLTFFRDVDEVPGKSDVTLPQQPPNKEQEEQFKRFFYAVSGEVILENQ